tara:strand:- start:14923 stop:15219 length:297 start_codon:yes stop_codon:yes gene_type:complete
MIQWVLKKLLYFMGVVYVIIDTFVKYPTDEIVGIKIDESLQNLSRRQLCRQMEITYGLDEDVFWNLPSTSKIRLGCQITRNMQKKAELDSNSMRELNK